MSDRDEQAQQVAWDARQEAIRECIADLAKALGTPSQSWSQLIEMAELFADIARNGRRRD